MTMLVNTVSLLNEYRQYENFDKALRKKRDSGGSALRGNMVQSGKLNAALAWRGPAIIGKILRARTAKIAQSGPAQNVARGTSAQQGQNSEFVNKLISGEWKGAFGLKGVNFRGYKLKATSKSINQIFSWASGSLTSKVSKDRALKFSRIMEDLLELKTGRALISRIAKLHHDCVGLPPVKFSYVRDLGSWCKFPSGHSNFYTINIDENETRDQVLAVYNGTTKQLDFVRVDVPEAAILAHELGHFVHALTMHKRLAERLGRSVCNSAVSEASINGGNLIKNGPVEKKSKKLMKKAYAKMDAQAYAKYKAVLGKKLVQKAGKSGADQAFLDCWNGHYEEVFNILPSAKILNDKGFVYGDGNMIGEALAQWPSKDPRRPVLFDWQSKRITFRRNRSSKGGNFVRFGHYSFGDFKAKFQNLPPQAQADFKKLAQDLLGRIKTNKVALSIVKLPKLTARQVIQQ